MHGERRARRVGLERRRHRVRGHGLPRRLLTTGSGYELDAVGRIAESAGSALQRLDPAYRQAAESLGAKPFRVLTRVTLPLLLPSWGAAAGLALALSMGELGATVMVYPATWKTLRVSIFGLSDRGRVFDAAACTTVLLAVTLLALLLLGRVRSRAMAR